MTGSEGATGWLASGRRSLEIALDSFLDAELSDASEEVAAPIRHAVLAPGKRVRPLLVMGAFESVAAAERKRYRVDAVAKLGCGVELIHTYSLIHDDLPCMDDDTLRRGQPTLHRVFGVDRAVLAGAALMPLALRAVLVGSDELGLSEETTSDLVTELTRASGAGGMVGGQLQDLEAEGRDVGRAELEQIHLGKTARLIEASCAMGAIAAGGSEEVTEKLRRFGRTVGLAFQVVDDILDVTGSTHQLGKTERRDEVLEKATMPQVLGLEASRAFGVSLTERAMYEIHGLPGSEGLAQIARLVIERRR